MNINKVRHSQKIQKYKHTHKHIKKHAQTTTQTDTQTYIHTPKVR